MHSLESLQAIRNLELIGVGQTRRGPFESDDEPEEPKAWETDPMTAVWQIWVFDGRIYVPSDEQVSDDERFRMKLEESRSAPSTAVLDGNRRLRIMPLSATVPNH